MSELIATLSDLLKHSFSVGVAPWVYTGTSRPVQPHNALTGRSSRGVNTLILLRAQAEHGYATSAWLTEEQLAGARLQLLQGESGTVIVNKGKTDPAPLVVYNVAQVEGGTDCGLSVPILTTEEILSRCRPTILPGGERLSYNAVGDYIRLPDRGRLVDGDHYFSSVMHALAHWSGHCTRLNRDFGKFHFDRCGDAEELIAEIGAALMCIEAGITGRVVHPELIDVWAHQLLAAPLLLVTVSIYAQHACDYVMGRRASLALNKVA